MLYMRAQGHTGDVMNGSGKRRILLCLRGLSHWMYRVGRGQWTDGGVVFWNDRG